MVYLMTDLEQLSYQLEESLLLLDQMTARRLFEEALQSHTPLQLAEFLIRPALFRIGAGWEQGDIALSQVYISGRLCEELLESVMPANHNINSSHPKIAIVALEDHHILGKRIIASGLRSAGFALHDYGFGVSAERLVEQVQHDRIELLLISTLMLRAALRIETVTARLPELPVIVGGAPFIFDDTLWQKVGATAMGRNSADAISLVSRMVERMP
jgi:trimethylamine corrinoid protein